MSSTGTLRNHKPSKFSLALAGSAVAVAVGVTGVTGVALAGPAGPAPAAVQAAGVAPAAAAGQAAPSSQANVINAGSGETLVLTAYSAASRRVQVAHRIAKKMMHHFYWKVRRQFRYLNLLWNRESGWNKYASNPYSGAYGIPQAVPGSKMASAGPCWRTCARTQIRWGMRYIKGRYGSPRRAWRHETAYGWY